MADASTIRLINDGHERLVTGQIEKLGQVVDAERQIQQHHLINRYNRPEDMVCEYTRQTAGRPLALIQGEARFGRGTYATKAHTTHLRVKVYLVIDKL